jgi:hypothetical protein
MSKRVVCYLYINWCWSGACNGSFERNLKYLHGVMKDTIYNLFFSGIDPWHHGFDCSIKGTASACFVKNGSRNNN